MLLPTILMRDVQWILLCWLSLHLHLGMIGLETKYHHKSDSDPHLHGIAFCTKSRSLMQHIKQAAYQSNYWKKALFAQQRDFPIQQTGDGGRS